MCAGGFSCRGKRQKGNEEIEKGGFLCRAGFEVAGGRAREMFDKA